jgi:hypothetical protein
MSCNSWPIMDVNIQRRSPQSAASFSLPSNSCVQGAPACAGGLSRPRRAAHVRSGKLVRQPAPIARDDVRPPAAVRASAILIFMGRRPVLNLTLVGMLEIYWLDV